MRVISGTARGKRLAEFDGKSIRPTPDKVRGAIFNILFSRIGSLTGKKVLDLCSGTGAMAIEALSRGAEHAWLVDQGDQATRLIPANLRACRLEERATFIRADARQALGRLQTMGPFDVIFLDPPYGQGLVEVLLQGIADLCLLAEDGIISAEAAGSDAVPSQVGDLVCELSRSYGISSVHIYIHSAPEV